MTSLAAQLIDLASGVTLAWDHELGWVYIDLAGMPWLHEPRDPHTGEWVRSGSDIHMFEGAEHKPGKGVHRYVVPDPARLTAKSGYKNPADHPFWKEHPISPENILKAYDAADTGTREQGRRWYSDVHDLAGYVSPGKPEQGAILLSTYSPQTSWPINMMNAHVSAKRGRALGPGEGVKVTNDQKIKAQKAIDGQGIDELMTTAKTHSFGVLIGKGDDSPDDPYGHVVVDTHAANVALGGTLRGKALEKAPISDARQHEYVADQYRQAAKTISEREGKLMKPHELQAITWLVQQRANQAQDAYDAEHGLVAKDALARAKGRSTMTKNAWKRWMAYAGAENIPLTVGVSSLASQVAMAQLIDLASEGSLIAQLLSGPVRTMDDVELAFDPKEPRDPATGEWVKLYHGTTESSVERIQQAGLSPARGNIGIPSVAHTLTDSREHAETYARQRAAGWLTPKVIEYHVPAGQVSRYLYEGGSYDEAGQAKGYAARKPLPGKFIHAVHDVGPGSTSLDFSGSSHCPDCGCLTAQLLELPPFTGTGLATELAAWTHERRVPEGEPGGGRWVKGGAGSNTVSHDASLVSDAHTVSAEAFSQRFEDAFQGSPYTAFVSHYTPEQIRADGMTPILAAGGKAGVLVHDHGDGRIEPTGLFNVSNRKGMGLALLRLAIDKHGANYVEAYGPVLNKMYAKLGFTDSEVYPFDPSMADPAWDSQRFDSPDYHMMKLPSQLAEPSEDEGLDLDEVRAAAADDPSYSEDAWAAALAVFGIEHP